MSIPKYHEIQPYILRLLSNGQTLKSSEMEKPLASEFNLTNEEISKEYESKNAKIFLDRVNWALSYLNMAGVVSKPRRGEYTINEEGQKLLTISNSEFRNIISQKIIEYKQRKSNSEDRIDENNTLDDVTPEEALYESFQGIKDSIHEEIIDTIISKKPQEFERLVVQLLQKMGYGEKIEDAGQVTQYTNDGGIDGIVKEDILGFGKIVIQAKRNSRGNNIGSEEIQRFHSAMTMANASKGVFITTSKFTPAAQQAKEKLINKDVKIVLIDREKLAQYIYDFNLGMQTEKVIEIKKLDSEFWESMENDSNNNEKESL